MGPEVHARLEPFGDGDHQRLPAVLDRDVRI
jgi:hypothetical protein